MKVLDAENFHSGLARSMSMLTRLETEMKTIETSIQGLVQLEDSLKGQGGNAIRTFYRDCHMPFLQFFYLFKNSFQEVLQQTEAALTNGAVESFGMFMAGENGRRVSPYG